MKKSVNAADFLQNMHQANQSPEAHAPTIAAVPKRTGKRVSTRDGLKHIGGYLAVDVVEKVAVLRARLRLDNSELIALAINELHARHSAKRAFEDN